MSAEGIQDFIGVLNVTLEGIKTAGTLGKSIGSLGVSCTRGGIHLVANIVKMFKWIIKTIHDAPYYKTGGKVKMQVLGTKFQDLMYNDLKVSLLMSRAKEYQAGGGNVDMKKVEKYLNEDALRKKFEELSKKYGLIYSKVPNFVPNADTGKVEYRIAFSKSQMEAYTEATAQFYAYADKILKDAKINDSKVREEILKDVIPECKPLTLALDEIGITKVTDEQFDHVMKETYPEYDPKEFLPVEPSEEKKTDFIEITDKNEYTQQKARGNVKEITFSQILVKNPVEETVTVVMDQYPNVAIKVKRTDVLDLTAHPDAQGTMKYHMALKKDAAYQFAVYQADPITKKVDFAKNPKLYEMTFKDFENLMKQTAEKAKARVTALLEQKSMLPVTRTSGQRKK